LKRVLLIIADGNPGGGTTHVLEILRGLSSQYEFGLVTQSNSYLFHEANQIGIARYSTYFFTSRLDLRIVRKLKNFHDDFQPDLVHVHGARAGWLFSLAHRQSHIIYTVHGYHFVHKPFIQYCASILIERFISKQVKEEIFVSRFDAEIARKHSLLAETTSWSVIHNGIALVEEIETKAHTKHVGFVGRLVPDKDPLLFLDVASRLRDFQITMIGGGELERAVNEKILGYNLTNVHMLGTLHHNQVLEELPKFSVVIITSRWEGLPYLPMEAMWRQVPVVAINVGGIGEIIENEESGLLVNNRSADELARAVRRLEQEPGLREQIVQQGRVRVKELFSSTQMLGKIQGVYERA